MSNPSSAKLKPKYALCVRNWGSTITEDRKIQETVLAKTAFPISNPRVSGGTVFPDSLLNVLRNEA
jgi:hypothetical protein